MYVSIEISQVQLKNVDLIATYNHSLLIDLERCDMLVRNLHMNNMVRKQHFMPRPSRTTHCTS